MRLSRLAPRSLWLAAAAFLTSAGGALADVKELPCSPRGVLTNCPQTSFGDYIRAIFKDDMGYIVTVALIMIIWSGVEYMLSGIGSADGQKKAKQRITGILSGVALLLLIDLILNQIAPNLTNF